MDDRLDGWWLDGQEEQFLEAEGFLWQTDRPTDICDSRVAFATEAASLKYKIF